MTIDIAYIILGHKDPSQIKRLVNRLISFNTYFYIHIDKRVDIDPFKKELAAETKVCFIEKREDGTWGDIGIVKATLQALKQILLDGRKGYCILLSGQDYPLKSNEKIEEVLRKNYGTNFAETWALPYDKWYKGGLYRIQFYKYNVPDDGKDYLLIPPIFSKDFHSNRRANLKKVIKLILHRRLPFQLLRQRAFQLDLKPYGGSQWWAITTDLAKMISSFVEEKKTYLKFHKFTLLADEIFFQSLIMHFSALEETPVKPALTYVQWEDIESEHPITFASKHLDELKKVSLKYPEKLFARKFDHNNPILNLLDRF